MIEFYKIQTWMTTELKLKGLEKEIFAIIYGFQTNNQECHCSLSEFAKTTGYSRMNVTRAINNLVKNGFVQKIEVFINNIKFCKYKTLKEGSNKMLPVVTKCDEGGNKMLLGVVTNCYKGSNKMLPNTIENTIEYTIQDTVKGNIDSYADTNIKRIDIYANPNIEKVVNIYKTHCGNLVPINKYYRSNIELKKMIGSYLEQTESNLEYFTRVCDIANRVKKIGDVNVDIKTILRNHESFYNGKYKIVNDDGLF